MKNILIIINALILGVCYGQDERSMKPLNHQDSLFVSDITTTHLIFDQPIKYLDIGSPYFVADTLKTMIKVKHIGEGLMDLKSRNSNLTVITKDGVYYSIPLSYRQNTKVLTYRMNKTKESIYSIAKETRVAKEQLYKLEKLCNQFTNAQSNIVIANERDDFKIRVLGIFYKEDHIGIRVELHNNSTIDLDIDQILIRLKLNKKITSDYIYQERVIKPINICDKNFRIKGGQKHKMILTFDKFTPNRKEKLCIDVFEKKGGRSATVTIPRKKMLTPKTV